MPNRIITFLCAALAVTIAGCVPFLTFVDFTPEMAGGQIRASNCLGMERVEYKIDGIQLTISASMRSSTGESAPVPYVFFAIPVNTKVELLSPEILVASPLSVAGKRVTIPVFKTPRTQAQLARKRPPTESSGVNFQNLTATSNFAIEVPLTGMPADDFRIELPDMKINGKTVTIPPIIFKKIRRTEIMAPLNC